MAKLVSKHFGMLLSVEPTEKSKDDNTWSWRKKYEGFLGIIHVYQSQHKSLNTYLSQDGAMAEDVLFAHKYV